MFEGPGVDRGCAMVGARGARAFGGEQEECFGFGETRRKTSGLAKSEAVLSVEWLSAARRREGDAAREGVAEQRCSALQAAASALEVAT